VYVKDTKATRRLKRQVEAVAGFDPDADPAGRRERRWGAGQTMERGLC